MFRRRPMRIMCRTEENLLVDHITRERDDRDTETGKGASEAVASSEGAGVSPCFAVEPGEVSTGSSLVCLSCCGVCQGKDRTFVPMDLWRVDRRPRQAFGGRSL